MKLNEAIPIEHAKHQGMPSSKIFSLTRARPMQVPSFLGPVQMPISGRSIILCTSCDASHNEVLLESWDKDWDPDKERVCVVKWLRGHWLTCDDGVRSAAWSCFCDDPFPAEDIEGSIEMSTRRYFHYRAIAKKLGATGKHARAKLPPCVVKRISEMYPDVNGSPTKVGFKRQRE